MKKRILSLLLAIVMVATALPLLIFTAMAEETDAVQYPETTLEEYNELYVQTGLTLAIDFFFANKHWGISNPIPTNPYLREEFDTDEERFDYVYEDDGETIASRTPKADLLSAFTTYFGSDKEANKDVSARYWLNSLQWKETGGTITLSAGKDVNISDETSLKNNKTLPFYLADGYIQFIKGLNGNIYMSVSGDHYDTRNNTYTMQTVMNPAGKGTTYYGDFTEQYDRAYWTMFRGVGFMLKEYDENNWQLGSGTYSGTYTLPETAVPFAKGKVATFTHEAKVPEATGGTGHTKLLYNETVLADMDVTYANAFIAHNLINFQNSTTASVYALRVYSGTLSELARAQNHFADLAKWFRLDISSYNEYINKLNDTQKLGAYNKFAGFDFDSKREDVQAVADTAFELAFFDDTYFVGFEGVVDAHTLAVAKQFSLNLDIFKSMPKVLMLKTAAWFASIDLADETLDKTAVKAAYIRVVEEDIWDYAGESVLDKAGYNALYETAGLVLQYDFFDSNEYWGGDYSNVADEDRLVMADTNVHTGTETLLPYKLVALNLSANRLGLNGVNTAAAIKDYSPSVGNGYLALTATNSLTPASSQGWGAWGRSGDSYASYMMRAGFYKEETYTLSAQYVASYSSVTIAKGQFTLGNVHVAMNTDENGDLYFNTATQGATVGNIGESATNPTFKFGQVIDYTQVIQQAGGATASNGLFELFVNGVSAYKNTAYAYTKAPVDQGVGYHLLWSGNYAGSAYAVRFYNAVLDADTVAKNHFADVAKWYKLGLVGWIDLSDAEKETVYEAFADVTVDDSRYTRTDAQALYIKALDAIYTAEYEQYKNGEEKHDAFIDVAAAYRLNVEAVVNATVDMTYVYANVTFETLAGKTAAEAQEILDKAVAMAENYAGAMNGDEAHDAFISLAADYGLDISAVFESRRDLSTLYAAVTADAVKDMEKAEIQALVDEKFALAHNYYSYKDGSASHDAFIDAAAEAGIAIEKLMALPKAERSEAYALDLAALKGDKEAFQTAVDAAVVRAMEKYAAYAMPEITEEQYNALYVTEGLTLQIDFFKTNKYWAPNGHDLAMPETLYAMKGEDGELLFDTYEERIVETLGEDGSTVVGRDFTEAFKAARSAYGKLADEYLLKFHVALSGQTRKMTYTAGYTGTASHLDRQGVGQRLPFVLNEGYITMNAPHTNTYMSITANETFEGTTTVQMVANASTTGRNGVLVHRGLILGFESRDGGMVLSNGTNYGFNFSNENAVPVPAGEVGTYSFEIYHPAVADVAALKAATTSTINVRFNSNTVLDTAIDTASAGSLHASTLVNFSSGSNQNVYAIRYYSCKLDEGDVARNHLADVAKFFKLDVAGILGASAETLEKLGLAFAEYGISIATSTREEAQAAYEAALYDIYEDLYMGLDEDVDKIVALAAVYNVDISKVVVLPVAMIGEIAKKLNADFDVNYANDYAILTYHLEAILDVLLGSVTLKEYTQEDYNKLYAQQDHLSLWFDFFSSTDDIISEELINTDKATFGAAEVPSVFRAGKMQITNISPTTNTYDRAMLDGFFRMHATASSGAIYPNIEVLPDERYVATDLYYSDYTWEVVVSDLEGHNQNMQIDNVRLAFGANGNKLRVGAVYKNDVRVRSGSHAAMNAGTVYVSSAGTVGKEVNYEVSPSLGSTITLRFDKDFTKNPVSYFKVTPAADGTYKEAGRSKITLDEAKELLGFEGTEEEFQAHLGVPARESLNESYVYSLSQFIANEDGVYVFGVRYPAEAQVNVEVNGTEHFNDKITAGVGSGYVLTGIGTGVNMNVYSLRRYDIALTDEELLQNHFVDLCKYYNLDITAYLTMDEATRAEIHLAMKDFLIKDDAVTVNNAWKALVKEYYYDVLKAGYAEEFNAFFDKAADSMVDLSALLARPASLHTGAMTAFDGVAMGTDRLVMQMLLQNAINGVAKTNEEKALELVRFDGYQVRLAVGAVKMPGVRANFVVDEDVLAALEEAGYTVTFGASVTGTETKSLTVYNGSAYVGETYKRLGADKNAELCFTYTTLFDTDAVRNKESFNKELTYEYWVTLTKEGEDAETYAFACDSARFGEAVSAAEVYDYFRDTASYAGDKMVYEVASATADKQLVDMTILGKNVAAYTLVYDDIFTKEMAEEIAAAIEDLTGTKLTVVARGTVNRPTLEKPAIWLMGKKNVYKETAALEGGDFAWYSETHTASLGIAVLNPDKLDGFVAAVKAELAAAVSEGQLTLGTADSLIGDHYFNAAE